MLSHQEIHEIEHELSGYDSTRAACIEALKVVQRHRGWVSDEHLEDVAALLGMSPTELDGVATFYNLIYRRPVGRHVLHFCDSVSCWLLGAEGLAAHLRERYGAPSGHTTGDGRLTVLPIPCLGACDRAPAILVDGELHTDLDAPRLDEVLEHYP
ncbi:MAG TPA: NADH-quinone oxidoreductase subunit NuoE [Gammaproteobacteria bacterium]|nr:NADH-quinone oxidoreductase subunit NuoE [Gammaproteobacteria bacterium]